MTDKMAKVKAVMDAKIQATRTENQELIDARRERAFSASEQYDDWYTFNFHENEFDREACAMLVSTCNANYFVGLAFYPKQEHMITELEVALVEQIVPQTRQRRRKPLGEVSTEFRVLQTYAGVGLVALRFTQGLITWGEFKQALVVLGEGDICQ